MAFDSSALGLLTAATLCLLWPAWTRVLLGPKMIDSLPFSSTKLSVFYVPDTVISTFWRLLLSVGEDTKKEREASHKSAASILITKEP